MENVEKTETNTNWITAAIIVAFFVIVTIAVIFVPS